MRPCESNAVVKKIRVIPVKVAVKYADFIRMLNLVGRARYCFCDNYSEFDRRYYIFLGGSLDLQKITKSFMLYN